MDDFLLMATSRATTLFLRDRVEALLHRLGLLRNPNKGLWEPTQVGDHFGLTIDLLNSLLTFWPNCKQAEIFGKTCLRVNSPKKCICTRLASLVRAKKE
jgi:hypothetical protein